MALTWVAVSAAACVVLRDATSVVVRPMMAVVESAASCLGVSEEMMMDICRSESTLCHATPGVEATRIANVELTPKRGDAHTRKWRQTPATIDTNGIPSWEEALVWVRTL